MNLQELLNQDTYISQSMIDEKCKEEIKYKSEIESHNKLYIKNKLVELNDYFDHLFDDIDKRVNLDLEQRIAILTDEDYNLIIAGAGSGKTTTMIGKIKYLIEKKGIQPHKILAISFARKNVEELIEKINKKMKLNVKIQTFHSLGKSLLEDNDQVKMPLHDGIKDKIYKNYFKEELFKDKTNLINTTDFLCTYLKLDPSITKFDSLEDFHKQKSEEVYEAIKDRLEEHNTAVITKRSKYNRSIDDNYLRSGEELSIANFLYLNGLDYEYESKYVYSRRKAYRPDFTIIQGENTIYLEHFGINEDGTSSTFSVNELNKYKHEIKLKRNLHAQYGTKLIETYSKYKDGRHFLIHLKELLIENGFSLNRRNDEEIYWTLANSNINSYFYIFNTMVSEFISKFKLNNYNVDDLDIMINTTNNERTKKFLIAAKPIYEYYEKYANENNYIDFDDMIVKAVKMVKENKNLIGLQYEYVIIDEYQDISNKRFELIKELSKYYSSKIIAVGDDWQSIFSFAGANVTLFREFQEEMGYAEMLKITNTYRNAQELIDVAGEFVQKDENSIKKHLHSNKHISKPVVVYAYNDNDKYEQLSISKAKAITSALDEINKINPLAKVLLIGRYNFDINQIVNTNLFEQKSETKIISKFIPSINIEFSTAHKSKGLEYDYVIIINAINSTYGFPSKIKDDPIFEVFGEKTPNMAYAEERRLFYVALTRTKNKVYIIVPESKPSPFVLELKENINVEFRDDVIKKYNKKYESKKCPICDSYLRKEYSKDLKEYVYRCINDKEVCDFITLKLEPKIVVEECPGCKKGYLVGRKVLEDGKIYRGCTYYQTDGGGCNYTSIIERPMYKRINKITPKEKKKKFIEKLKEFFVKE